MVGAIDLNGRCALVTGGGRGIGKAISLALAEAGASIAVNYRDHELHAQGVADTIHKLGRKAIIYSGELIKVGLGDNKDPFFGGHRLWLAHYNAQPKAQKSWEKYWLWQYADRTSGLQPNTVPGIPGDDEGNLDCNAYEGTHEQLKAAWAS